MNPGYAKQGCFYHEKTANCKRPRLWKKIAPGIHVMLCRQAEDVFNQRVKERTGEILAGRV